MAARQRILIVDGHSVIFAWADLRKLHQRHSRLGRAALVKRLRDYQDWSGVRVVVVFDGKGAKVTSTADAHEVQIFYSRKGQTADTIVERLASKYAGRCDVLVATSDLLEQQTVRAFGADAISPAMLRAILDEAIPGKLPARK